MLGATPLDMLSCRIRFRSHRYEGQFTPLTTEGTFVYRARWPIDCGGVSVDRAASDHRRLDLAAVYRHLDTAPQHADADRIVATIRPPRNRPPCCLTLRAGRHAFAVETLPFLSPIGFPCRQPSWRELSAVDLDTRRVIWRRPLGTTRDNAPLTFPFRSGCSTSAGR